MIGGCAISRRLVGDKDVSPVIVLVPWYRIPGELPHPFYHEGRERRQPTGRQKRELIRALILGPGVAGAL